MVFYIFACDCYYVCGVFVCCVFVCVGWLCMCVFVLLYVCEFVCVC